MAESTAVSFVRWFKLSDSKPQSGELVLVFVDEKTRKNYELSDVFLKPVLVAWIDFDGGFWPYSANAPIIPVLWAPIPVPRYGSPNVDNIGRLPNRPIPENPFSPHI